MTWQTDDPHTRLEMQRIRDEAERIDCDYCHARPGEACQNTATGEPLQKLPAHRIRMKEVSI